MRVLRILMAIAVITAASAAPGLAGAEPDRDAQKAGLREAIALEKAAADNIPLDFEAAKQNLEEAVTKLESMDLSGDPKKSATEAAAHDRAAVAQIDDMTADGEVTEEEMESLNWLLRQALALKRDALQLVIFIDGLAKMVSRKRTTSTQVQAPRCQSQNQEVSGQSSCFTLDSWTINIDKGAKAALCKFVDGDGDRLTNLRPLFEDVIQETTCRLTDKTVMVNGVEKRVVKATLKLSTLSRFDPSGSANVRVTAFWR